ncbi:hypothetical protein NDU88_003347 [Pleurodeles waltl]|uniref:Uncharacterized protein n=1 Tax=Pleurodeles waltl TaxID=8319 RepID=A0AAV7M495_PLEWA|nr:hypothetical protein NDU88_003347 [Pleurodeles waltl]
MEETGQQDQGKDFAGERHRLLRMQRMRKHQRKEMQKGRPHSGKNVAHSDQIIILYLSSLRKDYKRVANILQHEKFRIDSIEYVECGASGIA